jgi:hypothetical protein
MSHEEIVTNLSLVFATLVGLLITILLSIFIAPIIIKKGTSDNDDKSPEGISGNLWTSIIHQSKSGGKVLGLLEAILFFISLWVAHPELIAGWLVFKVGSKWEIWHNIIKVPEEIKNIDNLEYLNARHKWGTKVLMRFLIGTITNIIIAMFGTVISYGMQEIILIWLY